MDKTVTRNAPANITVRRRKQLRRIALDATPGPWITDESDNGDIDVLTRYTDDDNAHTVICTEANEDARFIATMNPSMVLGLLNEISSRGEEIAKKSNQLVQMDRDIRKEANSLYTFVLVWAENLRKANVDPEKNQNWVMLRDHINALYKALKHGEGK